MTYHATPVEELFGLPLNEKAMLTQPHPSHQKKPSGSRKKATPPAAPGVDMNSLAQALATVKRNYRTAVGQLPHIPLDKRFLLSLGFTSEEIASPHYTPKRVTLQPHQQLRLLLANIPSNRKINDATVDKMMRLMLAGKWGDDTNGIGIDLHGRVIEGQHRLLAAILVNLPLTVTLNINMDETAINHINTGNRRSGTAIITLAHPEWKKEDGLYTAGVEYWRLMNGSSAIKRSHHFDPNPQDILALLEQTPNIFPALAACRKTSSKSSGIRSPAKLAAFYAFVMPKHPVESAEFIQQIVSGKNQCPTVTELRIRLQEMDHAPSWYVTACTVFAWNAFIQKKDIAQRTFGNIKTNTVIPTVIGGNYP